MGSVICNKHNDESEHSEESQVTFECWNRLQMKKQKEREEKMLEQKMILGRFGGQFGGGSTRKPAERKRTPEERGLKSTVGNFRGGVLDVRHLLHSGSSSTRDFKIKRHGKSENMGGGEGGGIKSKEKKKRGKKKNKGKKKGGGKKKGKS